MQTLVDRAADQLELLCVLVRLARATPGVHGVGPVQKGDGGVVQLIVLRRFGIAPASHTLQGQVVVDRPLGNQGGASVLRLIITAQVREHLARVTAPRLRGIATEVRRGAPGGRADGQGIEECCLPAARAFDYTTLLRAHGLVGLGPVEVQIDNQIGGGPPARLPDEALPVLIHVVLAIDQVADVPVALAGDAGNPRRQPLAEGNIEDKVGIPAVVIPYPDPKLGLEHIHRAVGGEDQRATGGVLAKQRALGAAQDLHRLDVIEVQQGAIRSR